MKMEWKEVIENEYSKTHSQFNLIKTMDILIRSEKS